MRFLMILVAAVSLAVAPVRADEGAKADVQAVISSQIEAFRTDDFDTAFTFAAPSIQRIFRTPENFGAMVRGGYPMVWRPDDVRFGALEDLGGALMQRVIVRAQGQLHVLAYRMSLVDGDWRISGVQLLEPDLSA